jgi:predicted TIM-barrel fold metal-dependent hydrolase
MLGIRPMLDHLISADCHVSEPPDLWTRELPAPLRARGPRMELRDGRLCFVVEDHVAYRLPKLDGAKAREALGGASAHAGDDVGTRLAALEKDGLWGEVLYPQLAFFCVPTMREAPLQVAACEVYNDWLISSFAGHERIAAIAMLPALDVEASVRELERCQARGLRGGLLPSHADHRPYNDPAWEPLWETAAGLGAPLHFHAGTGRDQAPARGPGGAVVNYVVTISGPMETAAYLCASGALERHPGLRVGLVECGAGWLAWTLEAMDDAYREHALWVRPKLAELPSFYFRRQGFVTFQRDPVGLANVGLTGARCLLWGSDHPHPEGTFPESRRILEEQLRGVPEDVAARVVRDNAAELYGFAPPGGQSGPGPRDVAA